MRLGRHSDEGNEEAAGGPETVLIELLPQVKLFHNVDPKAIASIAKSFKQRTFAAGDVIAQEGSQGIGFFVIESGTAKAKHGDIDIGTLGPGSAFGEVALVDEGTRSATVAAETELKCWGLSAWEFRPIAETNPTVAWNLAVILAGYVRLATRELDAAS
jgi:CRP/FNR family transcriptional regulator, cyclic AMP receptor protein